MGGILAAIAAGPRPVEVPSIQDLQARNMQLQAMAQMGQLRQQQMAESQQNMQLNALKMAEAQRAFQDDQTFRQILADNKGNMGAALTAAAGQISTPSWMGYQANYIKNHKEETEAAKNQGEANQKELDFIAANYAGLKNWDPAQGKYVYDASRLPAALHTIVQRYPQHQNESQALYSAVQQSPDLLQKIVDGSLAASPTINKSFLDAEKERREQTAAGPALEEAEAKAQEGQRKMAGQWMASAPLDPQTGTIAGAAWDVIKKQFPKAGLPDEAPDQAYIRRYQMSMVPAADLGKVWREQAGFGITQQEQALMTAVNLIAARNKITLDPRQPWYAQMNPAQQAAVSTLARDLGESSDTKATRALAEAISLNKVQEMRDKNAAVGDYVDTMESNPEIYFKLDPELKGKVGRAWMAKHPDLGVPTELPTELKNSEAMSQVTLGRIARVRQLMNDPDVKDRIGPLLGRLGDAEMNVGQTLGLTDEQARKAQMLRSDVTYLLFGEGKSIFGGRMPQNLIKELKNTSPKTSETVPMLTGALDAVEQNSRDNILQGELHRFGGKTRPNFQPGYTIPATPNTPGAGARQEMGGYHIGSTYTGANGKKMKYLGGNPKDAASWQ